MWRMWDFGFLHQKYMVLGRSYLPDRYLEPQKKLAVLRNSSQSPCGVYGTVAVGASGGLAVGGLGCTFGL